MRNYTKNVIYNEKKVERMDITRKWTFKGEVRVYLLFDRRAKQIDPRLYWLIFHKVYPMYYKTKIIETIFISKKYAPTI